MFSRIPRGKSFLKYADDFEFHRFLFSKFHDYQFFKYKYETLPSQNNYKPDTKKT